MELKNQVCSLELAKRLKELGVKQESLWRWRIECGGRDPFITSAPIENPTKCGCEFYSAFTVAELGEMLPEKCFTLKEHPFWRCAYPNAIANEIGTSEADARAKMLICLIESKLVGVTPISPE